MKKRIQRLSASLGLSALSGWIILVLAWGIFVFVIPGKSRSAPEMGAFGAFAVFGGVFTGIYVINFVFIVVPIVSLLPTHLWPRLVHRIALGSVLFCLSVPIWRYVSRSSDSTEILLCMILAALAGGTSFAMLRNSGANISAGDGLRQ